MKYYFNNKYIFLYAGLIILIIGLVSCSSMNDPYKEFTKGGEHIYPAKADCVKIHPGKNRLEISWAVLADRSIHKAKVYWRNYTDSVMVPIDRSGQGTDTVNVMLKDLDEGNYTFHIKQFDDKGNVSVQNEVTGRVYGNDYVTSLLPRIINQTLYFKNQLEIEWGSPGEESAFGTKIYYTDTSGKNKTIFVNREETHTTIENYDVDVNDKEIEHTTFFLPTPTAIDTFKSKKVRTKVRLGLGDIVANFKQNDNNSSWELSNNGLASGAAAYVDRTYQFDDVGPYEGLEYIRPANDSKHWSTQNISTDPLATILLREDIEGPITFYVAEDVRLSTSEWIKDANYVDTGNQVTLGTGDSFRVWKKEFQPGDEVPVGGTGGGANMFWFFLKVN